MIYIRTTYECGIDYGDILADKKSIHVFPSRSASHAAPFDSYINNPFSEH